MAALARRRFATSAPKCLMLGSVSMDGYSAVMVLPPLPWNLRLKLGHWRNDKIEEKTG
jgi:hypothetical protein